MKKYYIYKYEYDNEIIYIGKTTELNRRIKEHNRCQYADKKFKPYVSICNIYYFECSNLVEMELMERALINQYKPILNSTDNNNGFSGNISVKEPKWKRYEYISTADKKDGGRYLRFDLMPPNINLRDYLIEASARESVKTGRYVSITNYIQMLILEDMNRNAKDCAE